MANSRVAYMKKNDSAMNPSKIFNVLKWLVSIGLMSMGIIGFQFLHSQGLLVRLILLAVAVIGSAALAATTPKGAETLEFIKAARVEARKVVWPARRETLQMTGIVIVMVLVAALFLWLVDTVLIVAMTWLTA